MSEANIIAIREFLDRNEDRLCAEINAVAGKLILSRIEKEVLSHKVSKKELMEHLQYSMELNVKKHLCAQQDRLLNDFSKLLKKRIGQEMKKAFTEMQATFWNPILIDMEHMLEERPTVPRG